MIERLHDVDFLSHPLTRPIAQVLLENFDSNLQVIGRMKCPFDLACATLTERVHNSILAQRLCFAFVE